MQQNLPLPQRIQNAPSLQLGLQLYWDAFMELSSCRPVGMGLSPIPWSVMHDYARFMDMDAEQEDLLVAILRAMDNAYLRHESSKKR